MTGLNIEINYWNTRIQNVPWSRDFLEREHHLRSTAARSRCFSEKNNRIAAQHALDFGNTMAWKDGAQRGNWGIGIHRDRRAINRLDVSENLCFVTFHFSQLDFRFQSYTRTKDRWTGFDPNDSLQSGNECIKNLAHLVVPGMTFAGVSHLRPAPLFWV